MEPYVSMAVRRVMVVDADGDNRDRPAAVSICHTDSRGWTLTVAKC